MRNYLKHFLWKATKHPHVADLEELRRKLDAGEEFVILDVREPAEYAFGHIPGAKSIPLGELEQRMEELNREDEIYVICRTGRRSDIAAKMLARKGFKRVKNTVPGMIKWTGPTEKHRP